MPRSINSLPRVPRIVAHGTAAGAFLLAASPLPAWYARRVTDQSDEPLGVIALLTAVVMLVAGVRHQRGGRQVMLHPARMLCGAGLLVVLQATALVHFPLLAGLLAVGILGCSVTIPRGKAGLIALLVLSLPLIASLDFYAGYPLRLVAAELAAWLLRACGLGVNRAGTLLMDGDNLVGMDPPCAGVRMLWTAGFTAAVVAARADLSWKRTLALIGGAVLCVVMGNSARAAAVFFPESGRVHWPHWMHPATGLVVHGLVLAAVFSLGTKMERRPTPGTTSCHSLFQPIASVLAAGCVLATAMALHTATPVHAVTSNTWPATLDGVPLIPLPLDTREQRFAQAFPGGIARFRCGDAEVILRSVEKATRLMHSSADCLRAAGFTITSKPVHRDADGRVWGCALAERAGRTWQVRERFVNAAQNRVCTDASAWFWKAALHPQEGPWTALTVMEER